MHYQRSAVTALIGFGLLACGDGEPDQLQPHRPAQAAAATPAAEASEPPAEEALVAAAETAAVSAENQAAPGSDADVVGIWELRSDPPQRLPGLRMTITVDSTSGVWYFGRLSNYFSGDVGIDTREFEPIVDSVGTDGTLRFIMPMRDEQLSGIVMEGSLIADTVWLTTFVLGPDTLSNSTRRWMLVRSR